MPILWEGESLVELAVRKVRHDGLDDPLWFSSATIPGETLILDIVHETEIETDWYDDPRIEKIIIGRGSGRYLAACCAHTADMFDCVESAELWVCRRCHMVGPRERPWPVQLRVGWVRVH